MVTTLFFDENLRKPGASTVSEYGPAWIASKAYVPDNDVWALKPTPVPSLVKVTLAFATDAPLESSTTPITREVVPCANSVAAAQKMIAAFLIGHNPIFTGWYHSPVT